MAELFVGPVMEKLIEKCFNYFKAQAKRQSGMKEELQSLRDNHPKIKAVVSAYSLVEIEDPNLNKCLWQLRDAIDEADDVFDEIEYSKLEKQLLKKKLRKVRYLMKILKKTSVKIGQRAFNIDPNLKRLEVAVHKLCKISAEFSTFRHLLKDAKQKQQQLLRELHRTREVGSMPTNHLLGRSNEMEKVRDWLRNPCLTEITNTFFYRNISVLSVVGHGGIGKTTLLQHVYYDGMTEELFEVKMWVCVSTNFDAKMVIQNILESIKGNNINLGSLEALQRSLQTQVMNRRFLLALDDVWEADETKWKNVLAPLRFGSSGSKILITTRLDSVAWMFANLIKKDKETLALRDFKEDEISEHFNTDHVNMVDKGMIPIQHLEVARSYWAQALQTNIENQELDQSRFLPILKLSYIYLPDFLQNCFTFCCIFPQDYEYDKVDLIRMWIALGFIKSSNIRETPEDAGKRYFNILEENSFFFKYRTEEDKVYYKMHHLLHKLAQSVSTYECFRVDDAELSIPHETIRHLYIDTHDLKAFEKIRELKNLRSLFLCYHGYDNEDFIDVLSGIFKKSTSIRLLVISHGFLYEIPKSISCLIHLRYLKADCYNSLKFPRSISQLCHLQFIISKKLKIIEMDKQVIKKLMPNENCQLIMDELVIRDPSVLLMKQLRSISSFPFLTIKKNNFLHSLPNETEQWFQQHSSSLLGLKFQKLQSLASLPSSLESLPSLQTLRVSDVPLLKELPNPPPSLTTLILYDLESLECLPSLSTINSLNSLELSSIPLLKSLPDLPSSLKELVLAQLESLQCLPSCLPTSLSILKINNVPLLRKLPDLPSSLDSLKLRELKSLECLPSRLPTLKTLEIFEVPRLLVLPDLPDSLLQLSINDCHSNLMEQHTNFDRAQPFMAGNPNNCVIM